MAVINGTSGNDTIAAPKGNNIINAGAGDDVVTGGSGKNIISGGDGNDVLYGGGGNDAIYGGDGNDILKGGGGKDALTGGAGADQFVFRSGEGFSSFAFTGGHGVTSVYQWVTVEDLNFADHDVVRITGFDSIFNAIGLTVKGTGSAYIDSQDDVNKLAAYLKAHPDAGTYFVNTSGFDGTTFILIDGLGHQQALTLSHIIADDTVAI
ncbi:calcium-binding protein [Novosphingobium capsulatum]|uniref:calcium-binding protein n=1 Tax=Novosphingobium capsulatum TaxID=13688 RepID=UPI000B17D207|nr:hypothetical protein [Novosphingobium capsulatum]WQD92695.1 hypothetical protein U0041_17165 [Novosphingobium capsulatum]